MYPKIDLPRLVVYFLKIATNRVLTDWVSIFCQNNKHQHQNRQLSDVIIPCIIPWLSALTTPCNPTDLKATHRYTKTTNFRNEINVTMPFMQQPN